MQSDLEFIKSILMFILATLTLKNGDVKASKAFMFLGIAFFLLMLLNAVREILN